MYRKIYEYNKLRGRIVEKYQTMQAFADKLGISTTTMSLKMNCRTSFSQEDIERWAELLDIPMEEYGAYFFA